VRNNKETTMKVIVTLVAAIFLLILPRYLGGYFLHLITMIFFFTYLGSAWNILGGYAGQFSFGHAAFFGIGAFTSTLLNIHLGVNPWIAMFLGGIVGLLLGLFIGSLTFRYGLRGPYFALAMLAVAEMLRLLAVEWMAVKYPLGITIPLKGDSLLAFQFTKKMPYYYITFFMMAIALAVTRFIENRKIGSYFKAIRENENAADALGVNVFKYKLIAMAISAFLTAAGGTFYAQYYLTIDEESSFGTGVSIEILLGPIIGGAGTVFGPMVGAAILEALSEGTRNFLSGYSGVHLMVYGAILVVVIIFLPNGILGGLQTVYRKVFHRSARSS
jgi:branched-chain amino acid transport system permease protein